jgi:nitronate monooxygenase
MLDFGPAVVFADEIQPVEAIFDRLIDDAAAATSRLQHLRTEPGGRRLTA